MVYQGFLAKKALLTAKVPGSNCLEPEILVVVSSYRST